MNPNAILRTAVPAVLVLILAGCASAPDGVSRSDRTRLGAALAFHAGFDGTTDAGRARGDHQIQVGPQWGPPRSVQPGLPPGDVVRIDPGAGRHGDALRFDRKIPQLVGYLGEGNVPYRSDDWSGTVSFWLRVTPDEDIEPGYTDPVQITDKGWDDAAFFVEFTKDEVPREFRLGAYADRPVWNPQGRKWEEMSMAEKPLAPVVHPPFRRDRWTHVVFTWERFNTGRPEGVTRLYLDGEPRGEIAAREQTFTWDPANVRLMLGLAYTGWMDDLAVFDRALAPAEVRALHRLPGGVADLY